jgi:hypothetical protein
MTSAVVTKIIFVLFVVAWGGSVFLLYRFIKLVRQHNLEGQVDIEMLSLLILSGDGRAKDETRALGYILRREYSVLANEVVVHAGDQARTLWFVAAGLMVICAISWMIFGW